MLEGEAELKQERQSEEARAMEIIGEDLK